MEFINEFINLLVTTKNDIESSYCSTKQDNDYIYLTFGLFADDCLFDSVDTNFEFTIQISKTYFEKYKEKFEINIEKQTICCNIQAKLIEINNCKLKGILRKIFLESAVLYLLYQSQRNNFIFEQNCVTCAILNKPIEIEKIQKAKKFILDNLANNLTINIVAVNVGTNQCYLKKGFKEVFKQTIFEFIQENRMMKAKHLLKLDYPNITDIGFQVGYSSLSSFSQSYKKYFGFSPTEQIKRLIPNN